MCVARARVYVCVVLYLFSYLQRLWSTTHTQTNTNTHTYTHRRDIIEWYIDIERDIDVDHVAVLCAGAVGRATRTTAQRERRRLAQDQVDLLDEAHDCGHQVALPSARSHSRAHAAEIRRC